MTLIYVQQQKYNFYLVDKETVENVLLNIFVNGNVLLNIFVNGNVLLNVFMNLS